MRLLSTKSHAARGARGSSSRQAAVAAPQLQQPASTLRRAGGSSSRLASHNRGLEVQLAEHLAEGPQAAAAAAGPAAGSGIQFDCLGLAQAMVDFSAVLPDDSLLAQLQVEKGSRRLIGIDERAAVLSQLEGAEYAISAGGSLSNTLMALARLGEASSRVLGEPPLRVCMTGLIGSDPLGEYYASQMRQAGVDVASAPLAGANTGTVCVLTSPDAQRTMLSYLGTAAEVAVDAALEAAIAHSRVLVIEGYLWELPNAEQTIRKAIAAAQRAGTVVAMTAGDAGVVERHHSEMWAAIDQGIDLLFTNASEAAALLRYEPPSQQQQHQPGGPAAAPSAGATGASSVHCATGEQLALRLGPHCSMVVVTDGDEGSYMTALGQLHCVPPCWIENAPVDTCGAGDAYAAGLLFGYLRNFDLVTMGRTAARVASAVISKHGAALSSEAALALAQTLPGMAPRSAVLAAMEPSTPK